MKNFRANDRFPDDDTVPEDFVEEFLGFFEMVGFYYAKNIVNRALVAAIFGDDILDAYEHASTSKLIKETRFEERNQHYYEWFICMAECASSKKNSKRPRP